MLKALLFRHISLLFVLIVTTLMFAERTNTATAKPDNPKLALAQTKVAYNNNQERLSMLVYYTSQSIITNPGKFKPLYEGLPSDVPSLVKVTQGILVHGGLLRLYGIKGRPENGEHCLCKVEDMLECLSKMDNRKLVNTREPDKRLQVSCRSFAVLTCSLLRYKGIPARVRAGYSGYTWGDGKYENHWILEYWNSGKKRWIQVDPQMDGKQKKLMGITFDTLDLPTGKFLTGGEAWKLCRSGKIEQNRLGLSGPEGFESWDLNCIGEDVVRDLMALNKVEVLPWDPNEFSKPLESRPKEAKKELLDQTADIITAENLDFRRMRLLYNSNSVLHMPNDWKP